MRTNPRHVDNRRRLRPCDYFRNPFVFGRELTALTYVPAGGDEPSRRIAEVQHLLVVRWRARGRRPSAAQLCAWFGISKQTLSRVTLGERWAGETVLAALVGALGTVP